MLSIETTQSGLLKPLLKNMFVKLLAAEKSLFIHLNKWVEDASSIYEQLILRHYLQIIEINARALNRLAGDETSAQEISTYQKIDRIHTRLQQKATFSEESEHNLALLDCLKIINRFKTGLYQKAFSYAQNLGDDQASRSLSEALRAEKEMSRHLLELSQKVEPVISRVFVRSKATITSS